MKTLLLELVNELEDLRANQFVLAARLGPGISPDAAQMAKDAGITQSKTFFDGMRAKIAALPE
jgi:hypothetical protein